LGNQIGGGVEQQPVFAVIGDCGGRLGESISGPAGGAAIGTIAVPLRNSASGRGTEDSYLHNNEITAAGGGGNVFDRAGLLAGVHVSSDFHAQRDFFKFRLYPVHICFS
jgi:hypothetical protein